MSNPLRGPAGPNPPPSLGPNQGKNPTDNRVASVANGVFSTDPGASPLPDSLSSRVSVGEVRLSKEDILKQWLESQPENAKTQAQQILDILQQKDLDNPFELDLRSLQNITSLPNVLQNCTQNSSQKQITHLFENLEPNLSEKGLICDVPRIPVLHLARADFRICFSLGSFD